ncbi:MAG: hypothetical protein R6X17_13755 [Candidatus Competibacteraceae bacterium]
MNLKTREGKQQLRELAEKTRSAYAPRYISGKHGRTIGVIGNLTDAIRAEHPFEVLHAHDFEEVTDQEYENTVLDWRFEHGEWKQ